MQPVLLLVVILSSLEGGDAACAGCLSESYEKRKGSIQSLLDASGTSSVIIAGLNSSSGLLSPSDKAIYFAHLEEIEQLILENDAFTPEQKLMKVGMKLDKLFVYYPAIEDAVRYQFISGWGPLCDFLYMVDEMNIEKFWKLSATPGITTTCLLYDEILEASKPIKFIKWKLYLENIPCTKSWHMAAHVVNLHHDIPEGRYRQYLLTLELAGYDMTVNQVQRVARSYYSSKAFTCRRLRDTLANYPAAKLGVSKRSDLNGLLKNATAAGITSNSPRQDCVQWFSREMAILCNSADGIQAFNKIFWNFPFGSYYDNIIYNDCQIQALKEKAPTFYN